MNFFSFAFSATQINSQVDESNVDVSKGTSPWTSSQVKAAAVMMIKGKTLWSMFRSHDFSVAFLSSKLYFSYATWEKLNFSCLRRKKEKQKRRDGASEIFALEALPHCLDNFFSEIQTMKKLCTWFSLWRWFNLKQNSIFTSLMTLFNAWGYRSQSGKIFAHFIILINSGSRQITWNFKLP